MKENDIRPSTMNAILEEKADDIYDTLLNALEQVYQSENRPDWFHLAAMAAATTLLSSIVIEEIENGLCDECAQATHLETQDRVAEYLTASTLGIIEFHRSQEHEEVTTGNNGREAAT